MTNPNQQPVWLPVATCPYVEVSDRGEVRSLPRINARGHKRAGIARRLTVNADGYLTVRIDGKLRNVHHVVMETFVGPRPAGMQIMHLDANRTNASLENLRYGTASENQQQRIADGNHNEARKTHCPAGHEYTSENTYRTPGTNDRACRTCRSINNRATYLASERYAAIYRRGTQRPSTKHPN